MASGFVIRKNQYYDSVFLMGISKRISDVHGVRQNAVLMGSETNKGLLADIGIRDQAIHAAQPSDLIVAVIADSPEIVDEVLKKLDEFMQGGVQAAATSNPHTFEDGLAQKPKANLAVISIPGEYAAREARKALEAGLNVFLFSDNVSIEEELELKKLATEKKLLVMGPDCGTSLIGGVGIGFANVVRRGSIGVIGAAGTGLQEFTSQVHNAGYGISHAIGTGGHDLSDGIGGLTTLAALAALEEDPATKVIAVISKPPGTKTLAKLLARFKTCKKPVVGCFLGAQFEAKGMDGNFQRAGVIDDAVRLSIKMAGKESDIPALEFNQDETEGLKREKRGWHSEQKYLRGILAGGTFCYQSQQILRDAGIVTRSNAPLEAKNKLENSNLSVGHTLVDMGADEFTLGRPHPMIDGTLRKQRILSEARDPQTAILFLDFILGYNASMDPVGELAETIVEAREISRKQGGYLAVVASICGTDADPQDLKLQVKLLKDAGAIIFTSNAKAASFCCELLK
jgi:succinyl-CoA synthetase alpha subunit